MIVNIVHDFYISDGWLALMSHSCVGRSFELGYDVGKIGEGHVTKSVYREAMLVFSTLWKSRIWFPDWLEQSVTKINDGHFNV